METENRPRPRKHADLFQQVLWWEDLIRMRTRHTNRISASERGVSNFDPMIERDMMSDLQLDGNIKNAEKSVRDLGEAVGPVWGWLTAIKGLGTGNMAARLLAHIDDIEGFTTVSKLWRFAGWAVIDGKAERNKPGEKSHYNRQLKSLCWLIVDSFIKQRTVVYSDLYYQFKEEDRRQHPETICRECGDPWKAHCKSSGHHMIYNDGHIHHRAMRKVAKVFLQHLWVVWRESEGLPVSLPYAHDVLGHTHYIELETFSELEPVK